MTTVLAFGAFDPLHAGHGHFLSNAATLGDKLIVALASDEVIATLKGHDARMSFNERKSALELHHALITVVESDASGTFTLLDQVQPDVIALGYDQDALRAALEAWMTTHRTIPMVTLESHEPEKYKSSLIQ